MCSRYGWRGIRFLSSTSTRTNSNRDPTLSLQLNHPTLVLLEKCSSRVHFKQILAQIMRVNLIATTFPMSRLILFSGISYPQNLDLAVLLFNHFTPNPNLYIYNTMISALSYSSSQSFAVYSSMLRSCVYPDKHTFVYLVKSSKCSVEVKQIHCHAVVTGWSSLLLDNNYLLNSLMKMYMENGRMGLAHMVFLNMPEPDTASYNVMIVGYAKNGCSLEALKLFHQMVALGLEYDEYTILGLLICCGKLGELRLGKSVHGWMERRKSLGSSNLILGNALMDMYVKCKEPDSGRRVFEGLEEKDVVSWNTLIAGFVKVGKMEIARTFFEQMPKRDLVSWNSLIAGHAQTGDYMIVRGMFNNMIAENMMPDNLTMVNLVSSVAEAGALDEGRWIHGWIVRTGIEVDAFLVAALIDMYCKCGSIERAFMVFKALTEKDVTVWTAMITGFAFHGYGNKALDLFAEMQKHVMPNNVTLVAILTACSHNGLLDLGLKIFNAMSENYGIQPEIEHYGCLVDLLGRSGRLAEAKDVVEKIPMKPSRSIWGTILSACRAHGNLEMAETALTELLKLEPEKEGGYILLSNIYAAKGNWRYSDKIRELMVSSGVKKTAGCSSVVVDGAIHNFVAADKQHPEWREIKYILNNLHDEMKKAANFPLDLLQETC